ncbi:MAG TPA: LD-carboxypeptidase [Candidatus Saccharimonadales bacterium]|nr:LD-carboxypeptidase [Candidatus Saccharimonadales bacterium]
MTPPKLHPGDLVAIISPSQPPSAKGHDVEKARHNFEQATSLRTVLAPNALVEHYYSAGTVQQRLDDFHWALKNPDVKAIIFSVGGNTAIELVDKLDYGLIKQHPKIIAGISDSTTLQNPILAKTGLITFLGLEFMDFAVEPMTYEVAAIKQAWFDGELGSIHPNPSWRDFNDLPTTYKGWRTIRPGIIAEGTIIGGNFSGFMHIYPTEYMPIIEGSILVTEFYMYSKRDVHSALAKLKFYGILDKINGLIIGYCRGSDQPGLKGNDRDIAELVLEVTDGYNFPIMQIGEIGHNVENMMLPIGARARLDAGNKVFEIVERVVQ